MSTTQNECNTGSNSEGILVNFENHLCISGSEVTLLIGDNNRVYVRQADSGVSVIKCGDCSPQAQIYSPSNSSISSASTSSEDPIYMEMDGSSDQSAHYYCSTGSSYGRYSIASDVSSVSSGFDRRPSFSSRGSSSGVNSNPDVQTDGDNSANSKRVSLPIPEDLLADAAANAPGFRKDIDTSNSNIRQALKQAHTILMPYAQRGCDGYFITWIFDKCTVCISIVYSHKIVHYAIRFDGHRFYIMEEGPVEFTITELIKTYINTKLRLQTRRRSTSETSSTASPPLSEKSSNIQTSPGVPKRPTSFLYLKCAVCQGMDFTAETH